MDMRLPGKQSTHLVIRDGIFSALVVELTDGNYIVLKPGDKVFPSVTEAMESVLGKNGGAAEYIAPNVNETSEERGSAEWFPDQ